MIMFYYPYPDLNNLIILPNPDLGNKEVLLGQVLVKQTLDGELFSFVRRSKPEEFEFNLSFSMVSRDKFNQVKDWVRNYTGYECRYHDWKNGTYKVVLVPSKINFIMDKHTAPCIPSRTESGQFNLYFRGVTTNG